MTYFCLSVDIEEDLPGILPPATAGIELGLPPLIALLEELSLRADFFFLSSVVRERPNLVRDISDRGHGIGNHGLDHGYLGAKSPSQQLQDISISTEVLRDVIGTPPVLFRAANFSADPVTMNLLDRAGYVVDSSVMPGRRARHMFRTIYDHRGAPTHPYHPDKSGEDPRPLRLLEVPVTGNPLLPGAPLGLGALNAFGVENLSEVAGALAVPVVVFLIHPWELIDLGSTHPSVPIGYARACSADLQPLRKFLDQAKRAFKVTTLADLARLTDGNGN